MGKTKAGKEKKELEKGKVGSKILIFLDKLNCMHLWEVSDSDLYAKFAAKKTLDKGLRTYPIKNAIIMTKSKEYKTLKGVTLQITNQSLCIISWTRLFLLPPMNP